MVNFKWHINLRCSVSTVDSTIVAVCHLVRLTSSLSLCLSVCLCVCVCACDAVVLLSSQGHEA